MLELIRNQLADKFRFLTDWEPGPLQGHSIAVVVTLPPHICGVPANIGTFMLPRIIEERLSFIGARAFVPGESCWQGALGGVISVDADFILTADLSVDIGKYGEGGPAARTASSQFWLRCWMWNRAGRGLSERMLRAYGDSSPHYGEIFRALAEQVSDFARGVIPRHASTQETAA